MSGRHPSHKTRYSDASTFDEICDLCGATDQVPGGWGQLAYPCPGMKEYSKETEKVREKVETVNHPPHYGGEENPYETIKVLRSWMTPEQYTGFLLGNAIKYLSRAGKKGKLVEDLEKARWYVTEYVNTLKEKNNG